MKKNYIGKEETLLPRVKNIHEVIAQKWNDLQKGVPLHYNDIKKIKC